MSVFAGKVIVLTGASEGIGRALALAMAGQRPKLVLAARNRDRLEHRGHGAGGPHRRARVAPLEQHAGAVLGEEATGLGPLAAKHRFVELGRRGEQQRQDEQGQDSGQGHVTIRGRMEHRG